MFRRREQRTGPRAARPAPGPPPKSAPRRAADAIYGINAANGVACLDALRKNARLQQAIQTRMAGRLLGVPPMPVAEEDEMLAGGNISVHHGSAPWGWIVAVVLLLVATVVVGTLLLGGFRVDRGTPVAVIEPPPHHRPPAPTPPSPPSPPPAPAQPGGYDVSIFEP